MRRSCGRIQRVVLTPQYTSTAMVYILSKETTLTSLADLQIGSQLTKDYKIIVTSRPVLEDVIEGLELNTTYKDLKKKNHHRQPGGHPDSVHQCDRPGPADGKGHCG